MGGTLRRAASEKLSRNGPSIDVDSRLHLATDIQRLIANPEMVVSDFDADFGRPTVLCEVPIRGHATRFAVPMRLVEFVKRFDGRASTEEVIAAYRESHPGAPSSEQLVDVISQDLLNRGLLLDLDDPDGARITVAPQKSFLFVKLPLIPNAFITAVTRHVHRSFDRAVMLAWLPAILLLHLYFYLWLYPSQALDFNALQLQHVALVALVSTLGGLMHEFGHAAAATHFGCKNFKIGWGLYIIYPVLWADVSDAWKLTRKQRVIVDVGGSYYQSLALFIVLGLFFWTRDPVYLVCFILLDVEIACNMNPFLRLDGYWILSDWFGIVNLRDQQQLWCRRIGARLIGRKAAESLSGPNLGSASALVLALYSIAGAAFFLFLINLLVRHVLIDIGMAYPGTVRAFADKLVA